MTHIHGSSEAALRPARPPAGWPEPAVQTLEAISAAVDGQADALEAACNAWREHAAARAAWHRYHLVGEALRSDDALRTSGPGDAAFLQVFKARLAAEPAHRASVAVRPAAWHVPMALAASVVLVCGALFVARQGAPSPALAEGLMAMQRAGAAPDAANNVLTDPRLDELLQAHQAAGGGFSAPAMGGTWRRVDLPSPAGASR